MVCDMGAADRQQHSEENLGGCKDNPVAPIPERASHIPSCTVKPMVLKCCCYKPGTMLGFVASRREEFDPGPDKA